MSSMKFLLESPVDFRNIENKNRVLLRQTDSVKGRLRIRLYFPLVKKHF